MDLMVMTAITIEREVDEAWNMKCTMNAMV